MTNDGLLSAGAADIEFKAIYAMVEGEIESRDSVLRRVKPGAAMTEQ